MLAFLQSIRVHSVFQANRTAIIFQSFNFDSELSRRRHYEFLNTFAVILLFLSRSNWTIINSVPLLLLNLNLLIWSWSIRWLHSTQAAIIVLLQLRSASTLILSIQGLLILNISWWIRSLHHSGRSWDYSPMILDLRVSTVLNSPITLGNVRGSVLGNIKGTTYHGGSVG